MLAIQACEDDEPYGVSFYREKKSGIVAARWNNKDLLSKVEKMMGWKLESGDGYRIEGTFLEEENAMIFDLNMAKALSGSK